MSGFDMLRGTPIVATRGEAIADRGLLALAVETMLPGDRLSALRRRLAARDYTLPITFDELRNALDRALAEEGARAAGSAVLTAQIETARAELYRHRWQAEQARVAYQVAGKENPDAIYWPNPEAPPPHGRPLHGALPLARRLGGITPETPIGSAGSCFALEIMKYIKAREYNYVVTEPNPYSCANWGPQYNAIAFQQTVEWTFGLRERPVLVWQEREEGTISHYDPFREGVSYKTVQEIGPAIAEHRQLARKAFESVEVFVLTVGLNEVWRLGSSDTILARFPRNLAPDLVRSEVLSVEQNVAALQGTLDLLRAFNPRFRMIVTVSPVPLYATFQGHEKHVVVATQQAKAILRVAVDLFAQRNPEFVTYFPAMETVVWCTQNPWTPDARHVSAEAVGNVMRLFETMFLSRE